MTAKFEELLKESLRITAEIRRLEAMPPQAKTDEPVQQKIVTQTANRNVTDTQVFRDALRAGLEQAERDDP